MTSVDPSPALTENSLIIKIVKIKCGNVELRTIFAQYHGSRNHIVENVNDKVEADSDTIFYNFGLKFFFYRCKL